MTALAPDGGRSLTVILGRGNSGTRMLSHTLRSSGVFMGWVLNPSGDKLPPAPMYEACRLLSRHVRWNGDLSWDFERLHSGAIDPEFTERLEAYLQDVLWVSSRHKGWKLPETTLAYPWIVRTFPQAKYIHIVRDPRDSLLKPHLTDDLRGFDIPGPDNQGELDRRVESWKYHHDIVNATPKPRHFLSIRYEDFVLDQERALREMEGFLGIPLARIDVDGTRVGRWRSQQEALAHIEPLAEAMRECGYSQ